MPKKSKEEIIELIKNNKITGISIDTCVIHNTGYNFNSELLQALKQFSALNITIIFSEIIINEIISHIDKKTQNNITDLTKSLKDFQKNIQTSNRLKEAIDQVKNLVEQDFTNIHYNSTQILNHYLENINAQTLPADEHNILRQLHDYYFNIQAPFENNERKRKEFPDAIALLSLEQWIKQKDGYLLVVSKDTGWENFATNSEVIICMEKLDECLGLFHNDNKEIISSLKITPKIIDQEYVVQIINEINHSTNDMIDLRIKIEVILRDIIEKTTFDINAQARYHHEIYIRDYNLNDWIIQTNNFNIISSNTNSLAISCNIVVDVTLRATRILHPTDLTDYDIYDVDAYENINELPLNIIIHINRFDNTQHIAEPGINTKIIPVDFGNIY